MGEFRMPSLGADMDAGTVVEWCVAPGDEVHRGDVVAVVETDKSDIDAEVFEDGVVGELLVEPGRSVPVGTVLATIVPSDEASSAARPATPTAEAPPRPAPEPASPATGATAPAPPPVAATGEGGPAPIVTSPLVRHLAAERGIDVAGLVGSGPGGVVTREDVEATDPQPPATVGVPASPRARRLAAARGVDLTSLRGSGPDGAIVGDDVEAAAAATPATPAPEVGVTAGRGAGTSAQRDRAASSKQRMAALMARSHREIPHYWVTRDLDFSRAAAWLAARNATLPPRDRILPVALLVAATARAAVAVPGLNGRWEDDAPVPADAVDVGLVTVRRDGSLLVPVLTRAESLDATATMARLGDLVRRARSGRLRASELGGATITVTNLGDQGADAVLGLIHPPQLALVGFGRVAERPWAEDGMLDVRPVVTASVAGDHRATEGHDASRFLAAVDRVLQAPESLENPDEEEP